MLAVATTVSDGRITLSRRKRAWTASPGSGSGAGSAVRCLSTMVMVSTPDPPASGSICSADGGAATSAPSHPAARLSTPPALVPPAEPAVLLIDAARRLAASSPTDPDDDLGAPADASLYSGPLAMGNAGLDVPCDSESIDTRSLDGVLVLVLVLGTSA